MAIRLNAIRNLCRNVKKIDGDKILNKVFAVTSLQQDILDLNREDQLYEKGITADGVTLGEYAANTIVGTAQYKGKIELGQRYDHITLSNTGAFYSTFAFRNEQHGFIISANTLKPDVDLMTYGNILGITTGNQKIISGWIKEPIVKSIKTIIFK